MAERRWPSVYGGAHPNFPSVPYEIEIDSQLEKQESAILRRIRSILQRYLQAFYELDKDVRPR